MSRGKHFTRRHERRGISLVWVALLVMVLLGLTGFSVDAGYIFLSAHQLQNTADAAALAAVRYVREDAKKAHDTAQFVAGENHAAGASVILEDNFANDPNGDIVIGHYDRDTGEFTVLDLTIQDPDSGFTVLDPTPLDPDSMVDDVPNAVRVVARRTEDSPGGQVPLFFGGIFGISGANVSRSSIAMIGGGTGAGMIALSQCECGLYLGGAPCLTVADGDIQINSDGGGSSGPNAGCGVCSSGTAHEIQGDLINTDGGEVCANFDGVVNTNAGPLPDPLAFLQAPPDGPLQSASTITVGQGQYVELEPGYYPEGISVGSQGELFMHPGIYVVGKPPGNCQSGQSPAGFRVSSGGTVTGEGVMIYLKAGDDCPANLPDDCVDVENNPPPYYRGAALEIAANAFVTLTPPDSGPHEHVSIFQARNNVRKASIQGGPGLDIYGALYFPVNEIELYGTGEGQFGNMIVAHKYSMSGSGCVEIVYTGIFESVGNIAFLVR